MAPPETGGDTERWPTPVEAVAAEAWAGTAGGGEGRWISQRRRADRGGGGKPAKQEQWDPPAL